MRKQHLFIVTLISLIFLFNCTDDEKAKKIKLLETIAEFNEAFQSGNVAVLESMITDDYIHTNGNSKATKKEAWLGYLNKRYQNILSGQIEPISYNMDQMMVYFYGNTAIVTAKIETENKNQNSIQKNAYRVTNIWVLENNHWKRAAFHDGKIE